MCCNSIYNSASVLLKPLEFMSQDGIHTLVFPAGQNKLDKLLTCVASLSTTSVQ